MTNDATSSRGSAPDLTDGGTLTEGYGDFTAPSTGAARYHGFTVSEGQTLYLTVVTWAPPTNDEALDDQTYSGGLGGWTDDTFTPPGFGFIDSGSLVLSNYRGVPRDTMSQRCFSLAVIPTGCGYCDLQHFATSGFDLVGRVYWSMVAQPGVDVVDSKTMIHERLGPLALDSIESETDVSASVHGVGINLDPQTVFSQTFVSSDLAIAGSGVLELDTIVSRSTPSASMSDTDPTYVDLIPDPVVSRSTPRCSLARHIHLDLDPVHSRSAPSCTLDVPTSGLQLDTIESVSVVSATLEFVGPLLLVPEGVVSRSTVFVIYEPDLSGNPAITVGFTATAELLMIPPPPDDDDDEEFGRLRDAYGNPYTQDRTIPIVVADMPDPIYVDGKAVVPLYLATATATGTLTEGTSHIRVRPNPNPAPDGPPYPSTTPTGRWTVDDLPDPPDGGYYWLGEPSSDDGTIGSPSGSHLWAANGDTPHAPSWNSFFPFKPSVRAHDSFLPSGDIVHHPKGVHFNSHFIEHMWLDWGGERVQPFTWIMAAMVVNYPTSHYTHYLLDAGQNPDNVGFPRISADQCNTPRSINDNLEYRNLISYSPDIEMLCARNSVATTNTVRARVDVNHRPKMFFGIFDGETSYVGAYDTGAQRIQKGNIDNGSDQRHRFYVMGRSKGSISQDKASHILVFEIRYWGSALPLAALDAEYAQLSSTYQFDKYRQLS